MTCALDRREGTTAISTNPDISATWSEALALLIERRDLSATLMRGLMADLIAGRCPEAEAAALLTALRMKGEVAEEIAAAASVLRENMVRLETGRTDVLDTCGTGGDQTGTFNISTATAFVTAAAGVPVVKHGNRGVSSRSGSADVLTELGVRLDAGPGWSRRCLEEYGLAFCFAPHFHPALANLAALRRRLKFRTLFNCLGPLANPAGAAYQLLGVGRPELLDPLSGALARLGVRRALVVWSRDGLDEVSLSAVTQVREVRAGEVSAWEWLPGDFGLEPCTLAELAADGPAHSAAIVRAVLAGAPGPARRIVIANAAAALLAAEKVANVAEGVSRASEAIDGGRAAHILQQLATSSQRA